MTSSEILLFIMNKWAKFFCTINEYVITGIYVRITEKKIYIKYFNLFMIDFCN